MEEAYALQMGRSRVDRSEQRCRIPTSLLKQKIREIAAQAQGTVAVACSVPGIALDCDFRSDAKSPMQSVFKLSLALAVLHKVEQGSLSLDQHVRFRPNDRILPQTYSALQEKYPDAKST